MIRICGICAFVTLCVAAVFGAILKQSTARFEENPRVLEGNFISVGFVRRNAQDRILACNGTGRIQSFDQNLSEIHSQEISQKGKPVRFFVSEANDRFVMMNSTGELTIGKLSSGTVTRNEKSKFVFDRGAFSRDGKRFVLYPGGVPEIRRVDDWSLCQPLIGFDEMRYQTSAVLGFVERSAGYVMLTGNFIDPQIQVWNLETGASERTLTCEPGLDERFWDLAVSPDARSAVAVSSRVSTLVVWDVSSGKVIARPNAFATGGGNRLVFSGDGSVLVCSQHFHSQRSPSAICAYRTKDWSEIARLVLCGEDSEKPAEKMEIRDLAVSHHGDTAATLHGDGSVRVWSLNRPKR